MIQAGRNGIIFHSCHAAFPFLHLSLSFGCAISFCKKQPFVKSSVRFSEKQGSFLFPFCPLFFLPDGNMAVPRYPVPPFVATSLIFPSAVPQPVVSVLFVAPSIQSDRITRKYLPILRTYSRNAHHCAGGRIALSLPLQLRFSAHFQNSFPPKSSSFSDAKIVCRRERLWKS